MCWNLWKKQFYNFCDFYFLSTCSKFCHSKFLKNYEKWQKKNVVPEDVQHFETDATPIFMFVQFLVISDTVDFVLKILKKIDQNVTIHDQIIEFCSDLARARSKCVSEDSKKMKKQSFLLKTIWNICKKKFTKIGAKKKLWKEGSTPRPLMLLDWIPPSQLVIEYSKVS